MSKILFISDYAPTESNSGGLVMLEQLDFLRRYLTADILVYNSSSITYDASIQTSAQIHIRSKFGELQLNIQNKFVKRSLEILFHALILKPWLFIEKRKLQLLVDNAGYDTVFVTVQGLYLAKLLNMVHFRDDSVVIQYWDPDSWWALNHNFSKQSTLEIKREHKTLNESSAVRKILVPSQGMAESLTLKSADLNRKLQVFYPALKAVTGICDSPSSFNRIRDRHKHLLLFMGNVYTLPELLLLVETVVALNDTDPNLDLAFVIIGPTPGDPVHDLFTEITNVHSEIYLVERLSPSEIDSCLRLADINFLPYPFTNRQLVEESFPSKFSKYLGAKKPILFLTPDYSSLSRMLRDAGISIGHVVVPSKTNIRNSLLQILESKESQNLQINQLIGLGAKYFSKEKQHKILSEVFLITKNAFREEKDFEYVTAKVTVTKDWTQTVNYLIRLLSLFFGSKVKENPPQRLLIFLSGSSKLLVYQFLKDTIGENRLKRLIKIVRNRRSRGEDSP